MKNAYPENYNSPDLVELWGDFIDWGLRRKGERGFLIKTLKQYNCKTILDASLGDGCDSIYLLKKKFDVTSNEIDSLFIEKALLNARKHEVELKITSYDWREFDKKVGENKFDAIILLGNSLTYLFRRKDQLRALEAFRNILKRGGIFIVDERNYQYMLDHKKEIVKGGFKYSKKYVYCGKAVNAHPIEITDSKVVMAYEHKNGKRGRLVLYPFKKGEVRALLKQAGFSKTRSFSDYAPRYRRDADFYQYVSLK